MKADTLFAELCPDMTVAEYCLAPPSEGVCCGCAPLSPPRPPRPPELTPPPHPTAGSARTQESAGSAGTSPSPSRLCRRVRPSLPFFGPARAAALTLLLDAQSLPSPSRLHPLPPRCSRTSSRPTPMPCRCWATSSRTRAASVRPAPPPSPSHVRALTPCRGHRLLSRRICAAARLLEPHSSRRSKS